MNTHSGGSCWLLQMSLGTLEGASGSQDAVEVSRSVRNYNVISGLQDSRCQALSGEVWLTWHSLHEAVL
jgi:hypothetical protein